MSTDQGATTRCGSRTRYAAPSVAASGPTPGTPSSAHGQFARGQATAATYDLPVLVQRYTETPYLLVSPNPPSFGSFSPVAGAVSRTASVSVSVTDSAGINEVLIWGVRSDGVIEMVYNGSTFSTDFDAASSISGSSTSKTIFVQHDSPGWTANYTLYVKVTNDLHRSATTSSAYTLTNAPSAPVVSFSPSSGGSMARADTVQVDVTDDEGASALGLIRIYAILADGSERLVAAGATIKAPFTSGSSRSGISGGYRYVVAWDSPGWPSTTAGLRVDAVDAQGRVTTSSSWSATITDPPSAPAVTFSPVDGGTTTRAGTITIDVTDDLGAAGLSYVRIDAMLTDGSIRGIYSNGFADDFLDASSRTSITDGYRYEVVFNGDGWPSSTLYVVVTARDSEGNETTETCSLTITDPPAPPDTTQPTVTVISPTPPGPIGRNDAVRLQVTDAGGLRRVRLSVTMGDEQYVIHNGYSFRPRYAQGSTMAAISGGFEYVVLRAGGWLSAPTFEVDAIDLAGNER